MKKIPSFQRLSSKGNLGVSQPQKLNINSPKGIQQVKKMFRVNPKIPERPVTSQNKNIKKQLQKNSQTKLQQYSRRKSSGHKKKINQFINNNEKQLIKTNARQQLYKIQTKLKFLQKKINNIKKIKKKDSSSSQRNKLTKQKHLITNKSGLLNNLKKQQKEHKNKVLKKSYSDKTAIKLSNFNPIKKNIANTPTNVQHSHTENQLLNRFVTQVPKNETIRKQRIKQKDVVSIDLKSSVTDSLRHNLHVGSQLNASNLYYIENALKSIVNPALHPIRQHIVQSMQTLNFLQNIRKPSQKQLQPHYVSLPPTQHQYSIILDLDETLIHCNQSIDIDHDVNLTIKFPTGQRIQAGVNIRPYAIEFLKQLSKISQVIVFTASHECYANVVLDYLDPDRKYISHRLFRDNCWQSQQGIYIKDLRVLGNRSLKNMVLVDNAAYSYYYQLQNGIPIIPYYDDKSDNELINLLGYIKLLISKHKIDKKHLHISNSQFFKLHHYIKFDDIGLLVRQLYQEDVMEIKSIYG